MKNGDNKRAKRGILLSWLFALCAGVADFFSSGTIFRFFTSHGRSQKAFDASATVTIYKKLSIKTRKAFEWIRIRISRQFERSLFLSYFASAVKRVMCMPGRVIGAFTMTWSAYVLLIALIKRYILLQGSTAADLWCGLIVFLASIPLMFSDKALYRLCSESPLVFSILTKIFGIPAEALKCSEALQVGQSGAVILGIGMGLLTYYIQPTYMLLSFAVIIAIALILTYPEGGVVISISIAPLLGLSFAPSRILAAVVLLTAFAYLVKVLRGKRVFKFGVTELAFFGFMLAVFLGGFAPGESNTIENSLLCCTLMLIFPLAVNLMKYKRWIKTCISAFVIPAALVAFIGIVQYSLGFAPSGWLDESLFSGITSRAVSVFNNPNILGVYLATLFPMALFLTLPQQERRLRVIGGIVSAYIVVCTVFTFSRSSWIALACGGLIFAVMISPRGILWLIPSAAAAASALLLFPDTVGVRLLNFATMSDSANSYRVAVWNSSWNMLSDVFVGGIGLGEEAFKTAYVNYAASGTQYAMHSHSLYMQIAIQMGVIGLLLFITCIIVISRKCFSSSVKSSSDNELTNAAKAAIAGAVGLLSAGMFDYTWYNFRVFFIFWALLGFACAAVNLNERQSEDSYATGGDETMFSVTVPIPKKNDKMKDSEEEDARNE